MYILYHGYSIIYKQVGNIELLYFNIICINNNLKSEKFSII